MGLLRKLQVWRRGERRFRSSGRRAVSAELLRICRFEQMEPRQLLSASPIQVGAVYFEEATGEDLAGDVIEITFTGGAPGTQLSRVVVDTDKEGNGLTIGDVLFDTEPGGPGAFGHVPISVVDRTGIDSVQFSVDDGGTCLVITFTGFDPGERLVFSVDVDEQGFLGANAVAEGNEFEGSRLTAVFSAPHFYEAAGTDIFFDFYDDKLAASGLDLPPDNYVPPSDVARPVHTAGAMFSIRQTPLPITIAGTVYDDIDLDNRRDLGEPGIGGVQLSLDQWDGQQYVATGRTTTTDAQGNYKFEDILPGIYRVVESQPAGYFSIGATAGKVEGATRGAVTGADEISTIALLGGEDSVGNDFAEARPAALSGHVYHDANNNGVLDSGEAGIGGAVVFVRYFPPSGPAPAPIEVTTGAGGAWSVEGLMPGNYRVDEAQPAGYLDGLDAAGTAGGTAQNPGDRVDGIRLNSGRAGRQYNFGELVPSSISGYTVADRNGNGLYDAGDSVLPGVTVHLLDAAGHRIATTQSGADGKYTFSGLAPGIYGVEEIQPDGYFDGADKIGTAGGSLLAPDSILDITLVSGTQAVHYDFLEILPSSISGRVIADANGNGIYDPGEARIPGVTVYLLDAAGQRIASTQTDAGGQYKFINLAPGSYSVEEVQPDGYYDGRDHVGTAGGSLLAPDSITDITLVSGTDAANYDFLEILPSSISGRVLGDANANCQYDPGEEWLSGVTVYLLDAQGSRIASTVTDANGQYRFVNLPPGTYGVEEIQPGGYYDGPDHPGSAGGRRVAPDSIVDIVLISGTDAVNYDFCEHLPVSLSGFVYVDDNNNGQRNPGESGIGGVVLRLLDSGGNPTGAATITDAAGFYQFDGLRPGAVYGVAEDQPDGYYDGLDTAGTAGGTAHNPGDKITGVKLAPGVSGKNYNFGELRPASVAGRVFVDSDEDGTWDAAEKVLSGVTVYLLDAAGNRVASSQTNQAGQYAFANLRPGTYGVEEVQPQGYFDGVDYVGSLGGLLANDRITQVVLGSGAAGVDYNFCELPPATISGYVFQDGPSISYEKGEQPPDPVAVRDGQFTPDDTPIAGAVLRLGDATGAPCLDAQGRPITAVTDARGYYEFTNVRPGVYTVLQVQPEGYVDSIDTAGSKGGLAVNTNSVIDPQILMQLAVDPNYDAILRIPLAAGDNAVSYNFSEVVMVEVPGAPVIPPLPPPPREPHSVPTPPVVLASPEAPHRGFYQPAATRRYIQAFRGGGGNPLTYTWHLSVVNAGQPRRERESTELITLYETALFNPVSWTGTPLDRGQWTLADTQGTPIHRFIFGIEGAIPVTGDFDGDGVSEVAVFFDGLWFIDLNGNGVWDEGDLWARLGKAGDQPITGDWDGDGKTDIGIFGPAWAGDARALEVEPGLPDADNELTGRHKNIPPDPPDATSGRRTLKRTAQGDLRSDVIDHVFQYGSEGDRAVSGDWNGDGVTNIGLFRNGTWYLDADGDGRWSRGDKMIQMGGPGDLPVVGDWNGDGIDDVGLFRDGVWRLDIDGDHKLGPHDRVFNLGGPHDRPIAGDFNGDGIDEVGVYQDSAGKADEQAFQPVDRQPTRAVVR